MKYFLISLFMATNVFAAGAEITIPKLTPSNQIHTHCMEKYGYKGLNGGTDFESIGACITNIRAEIRKQKEEDFY